LASNSSWLTLTERLTEDAQKSPWIQAIGRGFYEAGFEGIVIPSPRNPRGKNIVVFPKNLSKASRLQIIAVEDLK